MTAADATERAVDRRPLWRTLASAVVGGSGVRLGGMAFGFLVGAQLARSLGPAGYGVYGVAMSTVALLTVPTEFGLPQLVVREVAAAQVRHDWGMARRVLSWATRAVFVTSVSLAVLAVAGVELAGLEPPLSTTITAGLVLVPLVALANLRSAALRGLQHVVWGQVPDGLLRPAAFSALLFLASLAGLVLDPTQAMLLGAASAGVAAAAAAIALRLRLPRAARTTPPPDVARGWRTAALPMALTEGMRVLQSHLVVLILAWLATDEAVGVYRVATSLALLIATPATLFNAIGAPMVSRLHSKGDRAGLRRVLVSFSGLIALSAVLLSVPFLVAGDFLISRMFGPEYVGSLGPLLVLCLSTFVNGLFGLGSTLLNMTGNERAVTRSSAMSLSVLALVSPALVFYLGGLGAAISVAIAMTVWHALLLRAARAALGLDASVLSAWPAQT